MDVRQRLCAEIRVIYHRDAAHDAVYLRMFLPARRDFLAHLTARMPRPDFQFAPRRRAKALCTAA
ncbi:hypothetical protein GCN74_04745 [Janthinobacterium sp. FT14W]|uniref:hypothetical protein n=1 Tax=Janthinobacterium sp. FT14W TaxID=2654253 RepID=UPI001264990C|nr:hypothetical protein [Janthinobacterium sp. FT14W]KAB8061383.1 hypothetical protein GCN74_04745 [Janthinobacterium sp. FT14W]